MFACQNGYKDVVERLLIPECKANLKDNVRLRCSYVLGYSRKLNCFTFLQKHKLPLTLYTEPNVFGSCVIIINVHIITI